MSTPLTLQWLPGRYAVCKLNAASAIPAWALESASAELTSITRTRDELSIICEQSLIPTELDAHIERDFIALRVAGTLDMNAIGILSHLTQALARAEVPVIAVSTFDTDYVLVRSHHREQTHRALQQAGCTVIEASQAR